jgi:hypothetical protein
VLVKWRRFLEIKDDSTEKPKISPQRREEREVFFLFFLVFSLRPLRLGGSNMSFFS